MAWEALSDVVMWNYLSQANEINTSTQGTVWNTLVYFS